jgi:hypothetical protein
MNLEGISFGEKMREDARRRDDATFLLFDALSSMQAPPFFKARKRNDIVSAR